jgi:urea carboxylase
MANVVPTTRSDGIRKILIANRGACACRIIRTCIRLGIETVAVYTSEDRHSLHVKQATENFLVSSYLAQEELIKIAQETNAKAIHPGYGFLAENAAFARSVRAGQVIWIGPDPQCMDVFASKTTARAKAVECSVPVLSGSPALEDAEDASRWADKIGFPVLLKPAGGGGGIGMRVCENGDELKEYFKQSAALASRLFADSSVFIERFIRNARHIEVQVFGDGREVVHLGERECSVQRRFQKIIEEAPSPSLTDSVRAKMFEASLCLCKSVKYDSAGTVEFVYDDDTQVYLQNWFPFVMPSAHVES